MILQHIILQINPSGERVYGTNPKGRPTPDGLIFNSVSPVKDNDSFRLIGATSLPSAENVLPTTMEGNNDVLNTNKHYMIPVDYDTYIKWTQQFKKGDLTIRPFE